MRNSFANIAKIFAFVLIFSLPFISQAKDIGKKISNKRNFVVTMKTSEGDIRFMLLNETPIHRDNFVKLVKDKFYEKVLFHRIIKNFVIQAGDPLTKNDRSEKARNNYGDDSTGYTIPAEIVSKFPHFRGAVGAARESDNNPDKRSSGTQFYIVQKPNEGMEEALKKSKKEHKILDAIHYCSIGGTPHLDGNYTVFGYVIEGMDTVDAICEIACDKEGRALGKDVEIVSVEVEKMSRRKIDKKYTKAIDYNRIMIR